MSEERATVADFWDLEMGNDHEVFDEEDEIEAQIGVELAELAGWSDWQSESELAGCGCESLAGTDEQADIIVEGTDQEFEALGEAAEIELAELTGEGEDSLGFITAAIGLVSAGIAAGKGIAAGVRAVKKRKRAKRKARRSGKKLKGSGFGTFFKASAGGIARGAASAYGVTSGGGELGVDLMRKFGKAGRTARGIMVAANGGRSIYRKAKTLRGRTRQGSVRRKAAGKIAQLMMRAKRGDSSARRILTMLKVMKSPTARASAFKSRYAKKYGRRPSGRLTSRAVRSGAYRSRWNRVISTARLMAEKAGIKRLSGRIPSDARAVRAGIRALSKASARARARRGKVKTSRRKRLAARKRLALLRAKKRGGVRVAPPRLPAGRSAILVLPGGKLDRGKFAKVAA